MIDALLARIEGDVARVDLPGWSVLAWDPVEVVTDGADWPDVGRRLSRGVADAAVPFSGGCLGYLGYGAGHRVERVPAEAPSWEPEVWLGRYEGALCLRHADATWHPAGTPAFRTRARRLLEATAPLPPPGPPPRPLARTMPRSRFEAGVRRIREWIAEGDCYQVNLTRPVHLQGVDVPLEVFRRLPSAPFAAFLRLGAVTVLSNSPELFLEVRGTDVRTRPIKGTRPAAAPVAELEASAKDVAELMMIVDLCRNDLGRVAVPGSVRAGPRVVTSWPTVHHAAVEVAATLEPGRDAWDALAATFPPGSVTGAPKVRACQRIAELEDGPRGVYCGAIGFVSATGDATWSVAIRTAVVAGSRARYHVGGGIVAESDPAAEWAETVDKEAALARAFGVRACPTERDSGVAVRRRPWENA